MKKYWVTLDQSDYSVIRVEEIDETLKDGEPKEKDKLYLGGGYSFTDPYRSFLKGGVNRVTCSGNLSVEVLANSEEEAARIAPMECLKKRVKDLEESLRRSSNTSRSELERLKKEINDMRQSQNIFMKIIRSGELSLVNTGKRIIGTWYDSVGEKEFSVDNPTAFEHLVNQINSATIKYDDCY